MRRLLSILTGMSLTVAAVFFSATASAQTFDPTADAIPITGSPGSSAFDRILTVQTFLNNHPNYANALVNGHDFWVVWAGPPPMMSRYSVSITNGQAAVTGETAAPFNATLLRKADASYSTCHSGSVTTNIEGYWQDYGVSGMPGGGSYTGSEFMVTGVSIQQGICLNNV